MASSSGSEVLADPCQPVKLTDEVARLPCRLASPRSHISKTAQHQQASSFRCGPTFKVDTRGRRDTHTGQSVKNATAPNYPGLPCWSCCVSLDDTLAEYYVAPLDLY